MLTFNRNSLFNRKEVLIISITTAILLNFMLTQRLLNATTVAKDAVLPVKIIKLLNITVYNALHLRACDLKVFVSVCVALNSGEAYRDK